MGRVIAIDGPSGAGKSTISKLLAEKLGFRYLDTGALYRAVALWLTSKGITPEASDGELRRALSGVTVSFRDSSVYLNGRDVSEDIRSPEIGGAASVFSALPTVREFLLKIQRDAANGHDVVAEGRDMTTVVFPDAWKKFYLDASEETRAVRRYRQLLAGGRDITMAEAVRDVRERDARDTRRAIAPLRRADDAAYIDSTNMTPAEIIERICKELPLQ